MAASRTGRLVGLAVLVLIAVVPALPATAAAGATFTTLDPGRPAHLTEKVPVQVVLVGYEEAEAPRDAFEFYGPERTRPVDRSRTFAAGVPVEIGLDYTYDYNIHYADTAYEDAFFAYLLSIGVDERRYTGFDVSLYQFLYNLQPGRTLDVTNNLVVDPVKVERWLVEHPAPGIDASRNTIVFVNWWGRSDFRFHEYEVSGDPQSETGADFGLRYWHTRGIAWGGTGAHDEETGFGRASRTWFHDLSAGPEANTNNWLIDDRLGFGPDPATHTIFPPIWEYRSGNAERLGRWSLPEALGVVMRFVAVNLFFTPSPLYGFDPDARMTEDIELDVTVQNQLGRPVLTPPLLQREVGDLLGTPPRVDVEHAPLAGMAERCLALFAAKERCRPETDPAVYTFEADLYLGAEGTQPQWRDGSAAYEAPGFVQATEHEPIWLGVATDNFTDGTRTANFTLPNTRRMTYGYGPTSTLVHEYGHHFGVSHTFDGYEGTWGQYNYSANNKTNGLFHFAWVGNEVSSVMSYSFLNNDFSQFDLDNFQRWQATRYLRAANMIAADVLASRRSAAGLPYLADADASFTAAQEALAAHDYVATERHARDGYRAVRGAADATGTAVPASKVAWTLTQPGKWRSRADAHLPHPGSDPVDDQAAQVPEELLARFGGAASR